MQTHGIHSHRIQLQRRRTPLTLLLPKYFQATMVLQAVSSVQMQLSIEEWCDLAQVEAKRRRPAIAARLSGRAELFKERLDRERLKDAEAGVEYLLSTLRPYFVKDGQSVFRCFVAIGARLTFSAGWSRVR